MVRMTDMGQVFRGSLDEPVMLDGKTVLPRGADVRMKLPEVKKAGKLTGGPGLSLALVSISHDGKTATGGRSETKKIGAAAGGAHQALIKGDAVKIPSGTRLALHTGAAHHNLSSVG